LLNVCRAFPRKRLLAKGSKLATLTEQISRRDLLNAIGSISLRAETEKDELNNLDNFVPVIDFDTLSTPNTQMIYGRNGTGKTHLLRAYREHCRKEYEETKILPVYIDFRQLDLFQVSSEITVSDLIVRFYRRFLYEVIEQLQEFSNATVTPGFLEKLFGGEAADRKASIDESIEHLLSLLSLRQFEEQVKERLRKQSIEQSSKSGVSGSIGASSSLSASGVPTASIKGNFGLTTEELQAEKETVELVFEGLAVLDYDAIRSQLENIIEQCGATAIVILVDEWSSVDLTVQPVLAEMIRKTLTISQRISLKIVAYPYATKTSAAIGAGRQKVGLQSGIDIGLLVNLDELLNLSVHRQGVKDFLTTVSYKHVGRKVSALTNHSTREYEEYLCRSIFEDEEAYFEVVRASEGNPRDYLNILSLCCNVARQSEDKRVSKTETIISSAGYFTGIKASTLDEESETADLYDQIFDRVVSKRNKLFLVTPRKAKRDARIQELWHYRFIHLVYDDFTAVAENITPRTYSVYSMDYGKLLSLKFNKAGQELADRIAAAAEHVIDSYKIPVVGGLLGPVISLILEKQIGGQLRKMGGTVVVAQNGVEDADVSDVAYLVENLVIDDLLEQ
jgi:hypothetical protein